MILTVSIGKLVTGIRATTLVALPGFTIRRLTDHIAFGRVQVSEVSALLIHVGTNDIPASRSAVPGGAAKSFSVLQAEYKALLVVVRAHNSQCPIIVVLSQQVLSQQVLYFLLSTLVLTLYIDVVLSLSIVSAILPRPVNHALTWFRVEQVNDLLRELCDCSPKLLFNPTYTFFVKHGLPQEQYFSTGDRLHLSGAGVIRLRQAFQQALSWTNIAKGNHSRQSKVTKWFSLQPAGKDYQPAFHGRYRGFVCLIPSFGAAVFL